MANPEHVEIVKRGWKAISRWRKENPRVSLDLGETDISEANLIEANLNGAYLGGANLRSAILIRASLRDAYLRNASLRSANLSDANLSRANLYNAVLLGANLRGAHLSDANLRHANLSDASLSRARLDNADLAKSYFNGTDFVDVDLSAAKGLSDVFHQGPSHIDTATLSRCGWKVPEEFLRGCGFAPWEVTSARMYDPAITPAEFAELQVKAFEQRMTGPLFLGGIFISYSHDDSAFVDKLYKRLQDDGANVWLDRHDMLAGDLQKQVGRAIRLNDVVLLVLSESSVESDWVEHELKQARKKEKEEHRDVLCPVALDETWKEKTDDDVLWSQLAKKNILDFSKWKTKAFEQPFAKLVKGIKVNYPRPAEST